MARVQRILRATTASLLTYPRIDSGEFVLGQASTAEVRIGTTAVAFTDEDDAWASADKDGIDVAVTAEAAVGSTQLSVASAAWVAGRRYLVVDADGIVVVTAAKTVTGTTLYLTEPTEKVITTSATVKGWAITKALTAAQTDVVGQAVAVWRAVVDGVTHSWSQKFRIVRRVVQVPVVASELTAHYPIIHSLLPPTMTLEELIDAAWDLRVLHRCNARGIREENIVDAEVLGPFLEAACLYHLALLARTAEPSWVERVAADFERIAETTFARDDWHEAPQDADPHLDQDRTTKRHTGFRVTR